MDTVETATYCALVGFLFMLFANMQAGIGPDSPLSVGWFHSSIGAISQKYPTPVTPAGYTFGIWGLVYLWNFAWIVYVITTLYRKNSGGPVYLNPPVTSATFLVSFLINNLTNVLWLFTWDREFLTGAAAALLLVSLTLYACLYISLTRTFQYLGEFKKLAESDLWAYRVLVHNGLAIYAAWTTVATQVNVSAAVIYDFQFSGDIATYITLTILAVLLIVYFVFDLFVVDVYTRYVFMVYPTFIWALAGIMVANQTDTSGPAFIYSAVLVSVTGVFFVVKTVFMIIREPFYSYIKMAEFNAVSYTRMF